MAQQALSVVEARRNFAEVLGRVAYGREEVVIERAGRPMAVIINLEEYRRLRQLDQEQRAAAREARFGLLRQAGERNALSDEDAFAIGLALTEEVRHPHAAD
jgi:prevent-host-death family protein